MSDTSASPEELYAQLLALQNQMGGANQQQGQQRMNGNMKLIKSLMTLLANTVHGYHEAHGVHWNVKGPDFAQYHELFSNIYEFLFDQIDPTAENILKCGYDSPFHMSDFIKLKTIDNVDHDDTPQSMAAELLDILNAIAVNLKDTFDAANELDEQGVANFVAGYLDETQKWAWQLRASLGLQRQNKLV